jgi:hypothetical protein
MTPSPAASTATPIGKRPEDVHWGDVTALANDDALLRRITDAVYLEGDHSDGG